MNSQGQLPISIVTVTHNSEGVIREFLENVLNSGAAEIIVVDCGSTDTTKEIVESTPSVQLLSIGNEGYGRGNNAGVSLASQEYIFIVNPDVRVESEQLKMLFEFCSQLTSPAIVAPKMFHQSAGRKVYRRDSQFEGDRNRVVKVCGAAMMMPIALYKNLDGFDSNIFLYFEETDLCFRAKAIGADIYVCGLAEVEHFKSGSTPSNPKYDHLRGWHDGWSKLYFVNKSSSGKLESAYRISKTLIQTYVKILTKGISGNKSGQRREKNKLSGMKAFLKGEMAFSKNNKAKFTD
jgi:GT2 family glycosyltransferase